MSRSARRVSDENVQYFDIIIQPLTTENDLVAGFAVVFVDTTLATRLQIEVKRSRQDLETAYEELQSTNEELETTNEELQSSIEELETTNEELETTNEELQSGNEELETTNEEMRIQTAELDEARAFLEGVLSSVGAGVVVLDADTQVRSWNRGAEELWGLRQHEVRLEDFFSLDFGLPTSDLRELVRECVAVKSRTGPVELRAVNRIGRTITCTVVCSPLDGSTDGVVLLMEDITNR